MTLPASDETASTSLNSTFPSVPLIFSTRTTSPGATLYCLPPARITAYITLLHDSRAGWRPFRCSRTARAENQAPQIKLVLAVFPLRLLTGDAARDPERARKYRQTQIVYRALWNWVKRKA